MSNGFNTVVKDPIFWVHHANIDRLWESWNQVSGRKNPTDPNWRTRTFTWADADGNQVNVPVSGAARVAQLGYQYDTYSVPTTSQFSDADLNAARRMPKVMVASASGGPILKPDAAVLPLPVVAEGRRTATPLARRVEALAPSRQIYLVIKGLRAGGATSAAYGVYFGLPQGATPFSGSDPHFVGALPIMAGHVHKAEIAFNVTEVLRKLNTNKMLAKANTITIMASRATAASSIFKESAASASWCVEGSTSGALPGPSIGQVELVEV